MSDGHETAGALVSCAVTVKVQNDWFPATSLAVPVTVVDPSPKVAPELALRVVVTAETASVAVTLPNEAAAPEGPVASSTWLPGQAILGGMVSRTVAAQYSEHEVVRTFWHPAGSTVGPHQLATMLSWLPQDVSQPLDW